tara:strand:+ start:81847 stop:82620 length:774 start_codon:yes stop_codon:yes gene_type:complete
MNEDMKLMPLLQQNKTFTTEFRGVRYEYYLTGEIGDPEEYLDLCNILRSASAQDEVVIRINSPGGQVRTGNMIINAIAESEATVVGFIESDCGSMATFIFLACHTWGVSESAEFFAHTVSSMSFGKEHETYEQAVFMRKQQHKLMRDRYSNFLTDTEIDNIINGMDVYLDADQIMERLGNFAEARQQAGCQCGECEPDGMEGEIQEFDLSTMIEDAVSTAVTKALDNLHKKYDITPKPNPRTRAKAKKETTEEVKDS